MRVEVERGTLLPALNHVHRVVERRNTIPVLNNVLLQAEGGDLRLRATDLEMECGNRIPAVVSMAGSTTVPAHTLYEIVRKLPDASLITLELSGDAAQLIVKAGRSRFTLQTLPDTDFPELSSGDFERRFALPSKELRRLLAKTAFAISTEETRYYLNGIYLHALATPEGDMLRAVATDGHRLARVDMPAPKGAEGMSGVIIPRKAVAEIQRLLESPETEATLEVSSVKIRLTVGSVVMTSKLIDGTFPDYARVIPQNNNRILDVEKVPFMSAVDRVATVAQERTRPVKLALLDNKVVFTVSNPEAGSATEEIEADYTAEPLEIGFNAKYLMDMAGEIDGDALMFRFADAGAPTLVHERDDTTSLFVLMPMRV